ncbi:MAG TPA: hypothetical protein VK102_06485 [Sphingobacterium sp.]|nr:hypothetical protein [Sphingobacterium sp.]
MLLLIVILLHRIDRGEEGNPSHPVEELLIRNQGLFFPFLILLNLIFALTRFGSVGLGLNKNDGFGLMGTKIFSALALPVLVPASYHIGCAARIEMAIGAAYHVYKPGVQSNFFNEDGSFSYNKG